jgi:hypothetical protein
MRIAVLITVVLAVGVGAGTWYWNQHSAAGATAAVIDQYCTDCHNPIDLAGELRLDDKNPVSVAHDAETWEKVVRKLKTGMMPPAGEPRPERAVLDQLVATLEARLDEADSAAIAREPTALRRLNRTEYANAIRDLLDLDVDATTLLPLDGASEGFDNIAASLGTSPSLIEAYVSAAMKLSRLALGDRTAPRTQVSYTVPDGLEQDRHLEGLPIGTRGGMIVEHMFPLDAEYEIRVRQGFGRGGQTDITLDGEPIRSTGGGGGFGGRGGGRGGGGIRIPVAAGPHTIAVALVDTRRSAGVDDIYSAPASTGGVQGIEIDGPFDATGVGDTPSRRRVLICEPDREFAETQCAERIVAGLARRAFRRPFADEDLPELMAYYDAGREQGDFETGIQHALARILVDPRFLYRIERDAPELAPGTVHTIDDFELASRLSFFLWSTLPDEQLLAAAAAESLHEPEQLAAQVRRMLADPKANELIDNFAAQWLFLRELDSITPDTDVFDENLRMAMSRETKLLFETIMRDDLSMLRLLDADFTFVDERLAEHYGIDGIRGSHFRRIDIPAAMPRRGLLGQGSILTVTSVANRTSPVIRGRWILETLLGLPAPVPPPDVETTLEGDDGTAVDLTVRERLEAHRENPVCASCHNIIDPIGFTLENFDLIGAWRDTDSGSPIDTSAVLVDGTVVTGPEDLRAALLDRSEAFIENATEKLMTYALGRRLEYYDMPAIRAIVSRAAADDYRFSSLILGIVQSEPFLTRIKGGDE